MQILPEILLDHYKNHPEKISLIIQVSGKDDTPISYEELVKGAAKYYNVYQDSGLRTGDVVILVLEHGVDLVFSFWGAILFGAVPSIMPFLTEKLLPDRYRTDLAALIEVTKPAAIVTYPEFISEIQAALQPNSSVRKIILTEEVDNSANTSTFFIQGDNILTDNIALLQHSSGTTGLQKGVALSHRAILNQLISYKDKLDLNSTDVIVSWLPLYHDMGLISGFIMPIINGVPIVMMSPFDWVKAPHRLLQAVDKYKGTLSWLPNFAFNFCAKKVRDRFIQGLDLSSWRGVINCSEPMRYESHQMFLDRFRPFGLKPEALGTCYAMAENVFAVSQGGIGFPIKVDEIDRDSYQSERLAKKAEPGNPSIRMLSAGTPIKNTEIKIISENGELLPDRNVGEIAIRSDCMLTGYYHRPELTKKAFHDGWYLTGDLGYISDGELFVGGRKKELIIVGGKNIYPQDLEEMAMKVAGVHPGRVSAFGLFNADTGTEDVVLVAEVNKEIFKDSEKIAEEICFNITRGSAISLRHVHIVGPNWLVKTSSGKNARTINREKYLKEIGDNQT